MNSSCSPTERWKKAFIITIKLFYNQNIAMFEWFPTCDFDNEFLKSNRKCFQKLENKISISVM